MNVKKITIAALGSLLLAGAVAHAAPWDDRDGRHGPGRHDVERRGPGGPFADAAFVRVLKFADANKDGKVTKDEMTARQDALFAEMDANKDGFVTRGELLDFRTAKMEEFRKNNPPPAIENIERKPGDQDRRPDRTADQRRDRDRDHSAWNRHEGGDRHGWDRQGDNRREARWDRRDGPPQDGMMRGGFFRMIDEDRDGKISKAEATAASDKLFARMDTNKDGTISIDDLPDRPL